MKQCSVCGVHKELDKFREGKTQCKKCVQARRKKATKEQRRKWALKTNYGITTSQYEQMYEEQRGECYICSSASKLFVDHCHETGKVRGLLCHHCNLVLGHAKDNPHILRLAATYLETHDCNSGCTTED